MSSAESMSEPAGSYEFTEEQDGLIERLAGGMRFVGIFLVILGAIGCVGGAAAMLLGRRGALGLPVGAMAVLLGLNAIGGAGAFGKVVRTRGNDVANLMDALDYMRRFFLVLAAYVVIDIVVLVVGALELVGH